MTENDINLLLSKELNNPLIKALDFQSFLNMLVKLSLILKHKESQNRGEMEYVENPRESLESML